MQFPPRERFAPDPGARELVSSDYPFKRYEDSSCQLYGTAAGSDALVSEHSDDDPPELIFWKEDQHDDQGLEAFAAIRSHEPDKCVLRRIAFSPSPPFIRHDAYRSSFAKDDQRADDAGAAPTYSSHPGDM
jgi:hypothetical protein